MIIEIRGKPKVFIAVEFDNLKGKYVTAVKLEILKGDLDEMMVEMRGKR